MEPSYPVLAIGTITSLGLAYLMVSKLEFYSIKKLEIRSIRKFARIVIALGIALVWYNSGVGLLVLSLGYALSGPVMFLRKKQPTATVAPGTGKDTAHGA